MKKILLLILFLSTSFIYSKELNFNEYLSLKDINTKIEYINSITSMPKWCKTPLSTWKQTETIIVYYVLGTEEQKSQAFNDFIKHQNSFPIETQIMILFLQKEYLSVNKLIDKNRDYLTKDFIKKYYSTL